MWARFLYYFLLFEDLMIWTAGSLVVVTAVLLVLMQDFSWTRKNHLLVITLFFKLPARYMVYLAANYIQLVFVLQTLISRTDVRIVHLIFLAFLGILQAVGIRQVGEGIRSFLGSVLLYAAFLIVDLLQGYIFEMRFDWRVAFVYGMLCAFLVLYSLYFFINSIKCLASRHIEEKPKKEKSKDKEQTNRRRLGWKSKLSRKDKKKEKELIPRT